MQCIDDSDVVANDVKLEAARQVEERESRERGSVVGRRWRGGCTLSQRVTGSKRSEKPTRQVPLVLVTQKILC